VGKPIPIGVKGEFNAFVLLKGDGESSTIENAVRPN
jgi:hypothetical protein